MFQRDFIFLLGFLFSLSLHANGSIEINCPDDISLAVLSGQQSISLNISAPTITADGPYILTNDFTGTDDASDDYNIGTHIVTWTVQDSNTGVTASCEQTIIIIDNEVCRIPNLLTPNDDGYNDHLVIPCLSNNAYPENHFMVFNEWGDKVFEAQPYQNSWDGFDGNKGLPDGSYYYFFKRRKDEEYQQGFISLYK